MTKKGYPHERFLIDLPWLQAHLDDPRLRLIDARPVGEYAKGHLPGATSVDFLALRTENTDPAGVEDWQDRQLAALRAAGVNADSLVVVYDEQSLSNAARGVWVLDYFGHESVQMLDGGLTAWIEDGGLLTTDVPTVTPGNITPAFDRAKLATYRDIIDRLDNTDTVILDTRRITEYRGQEQRTKRSGTIPGAVHLEWTNHLDDDGMIRNADELRALFAAHGITPDKEIIPFCGGGYRSAHAYLVLTMLGYPRVRNYLGSWGEWGNRDDTPIVIPQQ